MVNVSGLVGVLVGVSKSIRYDGVGSHDTASAPQSSPRPDRLCVAFLGKSMCLVERCCLSVVVVADVACRVRPV
jgi:hypothetical protein